MSDRPSSRFARSLLPTGFVLLALWVIVGGYGIISGEFEESRPITAASWTLSLVSIVSILGAGWLARRQGPGT
ncbi:MAG: hypothetical protein M3432_04655 [Chloroflexota bacterium]|nr:hypothetical protein [Chloroflexota bacterium]